MFHKVIYRVAQNRIVIFHVVIEAHVLIRPWVELPIETSTNTAFWATAKRIWNIVRCASAIQSDCIRSAKGVSLPLLATIVFASRVHRESKFIVAKETSATTHTG